jgi:hypothetical protein
MARPYIGGGVVLLLLCFIDLYAIGNRKAANRKREAEDRLKVRAMLDIQDVSQMQLRRPGRVSEGYRIPNYVGKSRSWGFGSTYGKSTVDLEPAVGLSGGRVITYPSQFCLEPHISAL